MTAEAAPASTLGSEGQLQEEYIDYSEDDSAAPAVVIKGANVTSVPADAHFVAEEVGYVETSTLEPEHQTIDEHADAETDDVSVAADASLQPGDLDPTDGLGVHDLDSVSAIEVEDSYVNEDESLAYADVAEPADALVAVNEISWEDGPANDEDVAQDEENEGEDDQAESNQDKSNQAESNQDKSNQDESNQDESNQDESNQDENNQDETPITLEKEEWELVEEREGFPQSGLSPARNAGEQEETEAHEADQELANSSNNADSLGANLDVFDVNDADDGLDEQQAVEPQDEEVNDLHEIDFNDGSNVATVDAVVDASDTQPEHPPDLQETDGDFPTEQDVEDHPMGEDMESQPEEELESIMAVANADQVTDEETPDDVVNTEDYDAAAENSSIREHVEFDDEVLADERSSVSVETPTNEEMEIPVVTVSYKGIDYPFFYGSPDSQGKECFFNDLSLLHCKMEGVLAGFRRELANELGPFDELVFQIDELGLEFTESSQAEVFSDITLGQIISVFDSLVKNQNADASKPLYAYLTMRPNCKKRWLSLVDDAYNGKGLDEISYYFASRAQSEVPEIMDDEPDLIGEEDNADAAAWPQSPAESGHGEHNLDDAEGENEEINEDDDVGDGTTGEDDIQSQNATGEDSLQPDESAISMLDVEATMVDTEASLMDESTAVADMSVVEDGDVEDVTEDQQPQENGETGNDDLSHVTLCFYPHFCLCATCTSTFVADQMAEEDDFRFESLVRVTKESARQRGRSPFGNLQLALPEGLLSQRTFRHLQSYSESSITFSSTADADARTQAPEIDETDLLALGTQEAAALSTAADAHNIFDDADAAFIADQIVDNANESSAEKVTPNTSATSTLNGDEEVTYENELDLNADLLDTEDHGPEATVEDDGLAEIDWREFSGQGDDEITVESPSASGKRQRSDVDDLLDAEAQQDVKRRRP